MKANIVIASVLKPVNDPRMYEKIGLSLAKHFAQTHIHIVAFAARDMPMPALDNLSFYPIYNFKRLDLNRCFANILLFRTLRKIKPNVLIISTFELIPAALLYKWFFGKKLVYDVQENYFNNLIYTQVFPPVIRHLLAYMLRSWEWLASLWIDQYWLAEKCYAQELPFIGQNKEKPNNQIKYCILENKFSQNTDNQVFTRKSKTKIKNFILSGTISADYGVFEAIDLIKKLYEIDTQINLTIIGYCAKQSDLVKIRQLIDNQPFITLIGGEKPVSHAHILAELAKADMAILPYRPNKCFAQRIPTKFFEYLHFRLPMLVSANPTWEDFFKNYAFCAANFLNFQHLPDINELYAQIQNADFYENRQTPADIYWQSEEVKLIAAAKELEVGN
ncbi:MAG: glycosyltransferase [Microscillaceae bacterium]|nr:glycosyltransferase [Microscillaceae bacterium]